MKAFAAGGGLLLVLVLSVPLLFVAGRGSSAAAATVTSRSGPPVTTALTPVFDDVPPGGFPGAGRFPYGQCTWWAAFNRNVSWNGNGGDWLLNAAAKGYATSATPQYKSIVVYPAGRGYSQYGHVAVVVAVTPTSYTVSEMNYKGLGIVDQRTVAWPDPVVEGFIL